VRWNEGKVTSFKANSSSEGRANIFRALNKNPFSINSVGNTNHVEHGEKGKEKEKGKTHNSFDVNNRILPISFRRSCLLSHKAQIYFRLIHSIVSLFCAL